MSRYGFVTQSSGSVGLHFPQVCVSIRRNFTSVACGSITGLVASFLTVNAFAKGIVTMNPTLSIPRRRVAEFCRENGIVRLAIFGSALREDFGPESDIDVLVSFKEDVHHTLFDMSRMEAELKEILGHEVDLVSQRGIESSSNHLRRKAILESAEPVYGS